MKEKNWKKDASKYIYKNLVWIFLILSLIFIIISISGIIDNQKINGLINKLGYAIFSSGVFAAVLKSIQFTGLFKEEIEKVILSTEFIKNRNDLDKLWSSISKTIYKSKFPQISEILEERILKTYFPTNSDFYYTDYVVTINIEEITDDFEISYTQTCTYKVVLEKGLDQATLKLKTSIDEVNGSQSVINKLEFFKVDGEDAVVKDLDVDEDPNDKILEQKRIVNLKGKGPFKIHSKFRRKYSLISENYKLFRLATFTKNIRVIISHPDDVRVSFFNVGNIKFFEKEHVEIKNTISRNHCEDIILPYQGFGMSFEKIVNK